MRPLRDIASSGEIARVMLAVKTVLARHDSIPVLVFDEIDANIGGEVGRAVGEKLRAVAASHQVLCITHLPQVAVYGRRHFVVGKDVRAGRTFARIAPVEAEERAGEIARMLGGRDSTAVTLDHARALLLAARQ
jgi:DNA repair protein RecN (Recombination protein N)